MMATPTLAEESSSRLKLNGNFMTMIHFRTDSDFDPSERHYDKDGQTEGQVASFFQPTFGIQASDNVRVVYKMELGWNAWSRNDPGQPNQFLPSNQAGLSVRHKEIWAEWHNESVTLRTGYQHFADKSRLFLDHWGGLVSADISLGKGKLGVMVGQLPENTYEGVSIRDDNFVTDNVIGGLTWEHPLSDSLTVDVAAYGLYDNRSIDRPLTLSTLIAGVRYKAEGFKVWAHVLGQLGRWENSGVAGSDQEIMAWAAQAGACQKLGAFSWSANVFALSADDEEHGNDLLGNFFGSGKNASRSLLLTEDEYRDRYDNIDERIASQWGPFVVNRAGLVVSELALSYRLGDWYRSTLVTAVGMNLNPDNAFGNRYVGTELSLTQDFTLNEHAGFFFNLLTFAPGTAASPFVNDVDREATQMLYGAAGGFKARF